MTKIIIKKIKHYPISDRYHVKNWTQKHKLVFKQPKQTLMRPDSKNYIMQEKYDGSRIQYVDAGDKSYLINRRGVDKTAQYPEFIGLAKETPGVNIIDGEIIVKNKKGIDDFKLLAEREHLINTENIEQKAKDTPAKIMAFDILVGKNENLIDKPFEKRQEILKEILPDDKHIQQVHSYPNTIENFKKFDGKKDIEGVLFKDINSPYNDSKNSDWLKYKNTKEADVVITDFEEGKGKRKGQVGNMTMGVFTPTGVREIGKVGTGWNENEGARLLKKLKQGKKVYAKIHYLKRGSQGSLREPAYKFERNDISLKDTHASRPIRVEKKGKVITTQRPEQVLKISKEIARSLKPYTKKIELAGSIRRHKPPVDIDIVVIPKNKEAIKKVLKKKGVFLQGGDQRVESRVKGVKVDVFFATPRDWGAQLLTRTGSAGHNIGLRQIAKAKGMKLNEYGLWKGKQQVAGKTERGIYVALDRPRYKQPEERS